MPAILGEYSHKTVGNLVAGELFRMPLRSSAALCVMLDPDRQAAPLVGMLAFSEVDRPSFFHSGRDTACISYGTNWLLEPVLDDASAPRQREGAITAGILYLHGSKATLRFDVPQKPNDYEYLTADLMGSGIAEVDRHAVPVRHWKIWANEVERALQGGLPIVEFGAP